MRTVAAAGPSGTMLYEYDNVPATGSSATFATIADSSAPKPGGGGATARTVRAAASPSFTIVTATRSASPSAGSMRTLLAGPLRRGGPETRVGAGAETDAVLGAGRNGRDLGFECVERGPARRQHEHQQCRRRRNLAAVL